MTMIAVYKKFFLMLGITVLLCLSVSVGYSQELICKITGYNCPKVDFKDLVERDGLYYEKYTIVPFTGKVTGKQDKNLFLNSTTYFNLYECKNCLLKGVWKQ